MYIYVYILTAMKKIYIYICLYIFLIYISNEIKKNAREPNITVKVTKTTTNSHFQYRRLQNTKF